VKEINTMGFNIAHEYFNTNNDHAKLESISCIRIFSQHFPENLVPYIGFPVMSSTCPASAKFNGNL
jgi:hypothetical protein